MEQYHNFLVYFKLEGSDVCFRQFLDYKGVIFAADSLSSANFYAHSHKPFEWLKDIKHCSIFATYDLGPVDVVLSLWLLPVRTQSDSPISRAARILVCSEISLLMKFS